MTDSFAGSRWWRFDFHTHTPFSTDTAWHNLLGEPGSLQPEDWLRQFMEAGVDCVAITDHNGAGWIDLLKKTYDGLRDSHQRATWFRDLYLFPGVEISVNGGIHLLAIFEPAADQAKIDDLLSRAGYRGTRGDAQARTEKSILEVIRCVAECGAIAVPAHADLKNGLLQARSDNPTKSVVDASTLADIVKSGGLYAAERNDLAQPLPLCCKAECEDWTWVLGSDCHNWRSGPQPGERFTWVKMGEPNLEGLRLALLDGSPLSIRRSDEGVLEPNRHAGLFIEQIEIKDARVAGNGAPLLVRFSPWLSALIGGRGSGKSTVIELLRLAMRRKEEIPTSLTDLHEFFKVAAGRNDDGALTEHTQLTVSLRKDGQHFRVHWGVTGEGPVVEEQTDDGEWRKAPDDFSSRFAVRFFSQKQIFALSKDQGALLALIDRTREVAKADWQQEYLAATTKFLSLRTQRRELDGKLADRSRLEGELADIGRKLTLFESGENRTTLQHYQRVRRQRRVLDERREELAVVAGQLRQVGEQIKPSDLPEAEFDTSEDTERGALSLLQDASRVQQSIAERVEALATEAEVYAREWTTRLSVSPWTESERTADTAYNQLVAVLAAAGIEDPAGYGALVQRRQVLEKRLQEATDLEASAARLDEEAVSQLLVVERLREELTTKRSAFLNIVLAGNEFVRMRVVPYGNDPSTLEPVFRQKIAKEGDAFQDDILSADGRRGVLADLYAGLPDDEPGRAASLASGVRKLKTDISRARSSGLWDGRHGKLVKHLQTLREDAVDQLQLWWPEDTLEIAYRNGTHGDWQSIQQGSPGQKSAAILAFVLSFGDEPIVLDQPEDDLDNHLIYDLIVNQIRSLKSRRQVIVATHNPNIVVNGDAERVIALEYSSGQCRLLNRGTGCLQDRGVRDEICRVMEGGRKAFEERYRRIAKEVGDV